MHIQDLLQKHQQKPSVSVPDWMLGCFKRRSISFANGQTDIDTHVFWLQSRNITIDLRLPIAIDQVKAKPLSFCSAEELHALANYEGWYAETTWQDELLSWSGGTALQTNNRWPEPAILFRTGDCMMEFSPNNTYVEDWRIKSRTAGPLVGLRLIDETNITQGKVTHRDGALIINNDWAGLVLGREAPLAMPTHKTKLREFVDQHHADKNLIEQAFNFETSVAVGGVETGFTVAYSTQPERNTQPLLDLNGFDFDKENNQIYHHFEQNGEKFVRRFTIDTIEADVAFSAITEFAPEAEQWFNDEIETLGRYLHIVE